MKFPVKQNLTHLESHERVGRACARRCTLYRHFWAPFFVTLTIPSLSVLSCEQCLLSSLVQGLHTIMLLVFTYPLRFSILLCGVLELLTVQTLSSVKILQHDQKIFSLCFNQYGHSCFYLMAILSTLYYSVRDILSLKYLVYHVYEGNQHTVRPRKV